MTVAAAAAATATAQLQLQLLRTPDTTNSDCAVTEAYEHDGMHIITYFQPAA